MTTKSMTIDMTTVSESVLNNKYTMITHILCEWHTSQNFAKNFSLSFCNKPQGSKTNIEKLIYVETPEEFDKLSQDIINTLETTKYQNSINYLKDMLLINHKWARSHLPWAFTGGVQITC